MNFFLDSSFAIDFLRNRPEAVERFTRLVEGGDNAFINDVVVCELATGSPADDRGLRAFIRAVEYVQPPPDVSVVAGQWRRDARRRGFTLSVPDALIAATASTLGARLLTRNVRHFELTSIPIEQY